MSEAIQKFVFADVNEVRVVMRKNEPWFVAKDVCKILGTRTDHVRQIVGNKRVATVNPHQMGVGNHCGRPQEYVYFITRHWCGSSKCRQYPHWESIAIHRFGSYY